MRKVKLVFLTVKQIRDIMLEGKPMPTAIFSARKRNYIVKPRTIFGIPRKSKGRIRL